MAEWRADKLLVTSYDNAAIYQDVSHNFLLVASRCEWTRSRKLNDWENVLLLLLYLYYEFFNYIQMVLG